MRYFYVFYSYFVFTCFFVIFHSFLYWLYIHILFYIQSILYINMKIFHGTIITCDSEFNISQYLVEDEGKIKYVGNELPTQYNENNETIELGEKVLLPSFGDGHIHFSNWALFNSTFDVREAKNISEIGKSIIEYANRDKKAKVIFGFGHSKHSIEEKRLITREELDNIYADRPIYIVNYDGHSSCINSKTVELLPDDIKALRGFNKDTGQLFHEAFLKATDFISGKVPVTSLLKFILNGVDELANQGIGMVHTVEGVGFPKDLDVDMVRTIAKGSQIQFRIYFQTMDVEKVLKRKLPRIGGCFAAALDGCFGAKDAALLEPYSDDPNNKGILYYTDDVVNQFVKKANRADLQVQIHTIGDAAVVQAVNAIEAALKDHPREDHRHTIIHACLIPPETLKKIVDLKIGITLQPSFLVSPLEPLEYLQEIMGDRILAGSPIKKLHDLGIHVSGGSDGPVTAPNPIEGIYASCNHYVPEQSVSIEQAIKMYTYNIAWTTFDEKERGSLETGKIADMVILNKNPLSMNPKDLMQLQVEKIYIAGGDYQKGKGLGSVAWKAITKGKKKKI
jgi:predicted amidohydrolase YtcJ